MVEREHPLNEIAGLNAVAPKPREVFYDDTVDLPGLDHRQKFLYRRALKICTRMAVINKFQDLTVIPFRQRHGLFPEDQLLVGNTQTLGLKVLHGQADIKGDHIFFVHGSTAFPWNSLLKRKVTWIFRSWSISIRSISRSISSAVSAWSCVSDFASFSIAR